MKMLSTEQTAFDAKVADIEAVVQWMVQHPEASSSGFRHTDSTSFIAIVRHIKAGPGQRTAIRIFDMLPELYLNY